ncbi:hypothetical protein WUBG_18542 [Wuchereria bancrofti]|uniref:Uncharacterized protein n=1 Tax=Wuchereria bancrofti TaxID=6293 RepID=J9DM83_WUCBA|nr:hypothetical protein WUBG_18542 [Wuchereria bancrofti]
MEYLNTHLETTATTHGETARGGMDAMKLFILFHFTKIADQSLHDNDEFSNISEKLVHGIVFGEELEW